MNKLSVLFLAALLAISTVLTVNPLDTVAQSSKEEYLQDGNFYEDNLEPIDSIIQPYAEDLLSEIIKQEVPRYCGSIARTIKPSYSIASLSGMQLGELPLTPYADLEETPDADLEEIPEADLEETPEADLEITPNAAQWSSEIRISDSGSRIVLPFVKYANYGYCHIFDRHMKYANNRAKHTGPNDASQFTYAKYPAQTMDIIMEAINGTTLLVPDPKIPNRYTKSAYSKKERQNVTVVLHRGSNWDGFGAYDWVIISAYPWF